MRLERQSRWDVWANCALRQERARRIAAASLRAGFAQEASHGCAEKLVFDPTLGTPQEILPSGVNFSGNIERGETCEGSLRRLL